MTKDMTQGSPLKLLLAFAVPLMLGSLFQQFYNLADTIIVGRFVGVEALAAVGSVGGLNYLVLGFVNGIACGFSIPISWTFGAHDHHEMRRYTANTVWLSIAFATVLTIVTVAMTRLVLVWTNTPADIIDLADIYIRTIFAGIPFTLLYNVTSALMRALGDSKRPLYFLLVASFLNIGLDLVCIIMFHMGAFGAAFATVVSQAVAGLGSLLYILRHYPELRWSREEGCFSLTHCAKLCSMGDGLNIFASNNVLYDGVFCRNSDDCTTVYGTRMGFTGGCKNITMQNSTLWADVAHPIFIGIHGNTKNPEVLENLNYINIDILDHKEKQLDYQGCLAINAGDNNLIRNVRFENIRIENFRQGQLVNLRIFFNEKYCTAPGKGIEDILFKDISYTGENAEVSMIIGYDKERKVKNIRFENLQINGKVIYDDMPGKPKGYKTGDMARIFVGEHTEGVTFSK